MNVFISQPFIVSEIFAAGTLLKAGEMVESFERQQLKENIEVLTHHHGKQTRGTIDRIVDDNTVEIDGSLTFISDILFIIL